MRPGGVGDPKVEISSLLHPLNKPVRESDVLREVEQVEIPDVAAEVSLELSG